MHGKKLIVVALLGACSDSKECVTPTLDEKICDPAVVTFSLASTNPYYPLQPGSLAVLEGTEEGKQIRIERRVLGETQLIMGVMTRVLEAREIQGGVLYELARNFYVEAADGTVCYFGEDVEFFENGEVVSREGSWRAGSRGAKPGIIMPAAPKVGDAYFQENAPDVALDQGRVSATGATMTFAGKSYDNVITIQDSNPLDDEDACEEEMKQYVPGVGEVVDTVKSLVSFTPPPP